MEVAGWARPPLVSLGHRLPQSNTLVAFDPPFNPAGMVTGVGSWDSGTDIKVYKVSGRSPHLECQVGFVQTRAGTPNTCTSSRL